MGKKIGLIDVDSHNYPNLPLMKISAYHKNRGDHVEWYQPLFSGHMDIVYMSKVFSFTPDYEYFIDADEIHRGGTGYAITLVNGREIYDKSKDKSLPELPVEQIMRNHRPPRTMDEKQNRSEALKQGVASWTQFYHKPYQTDWRDAHRKAIDKKWRCYDK